MKKILFIANHRRDRAPGQRFRFEQYFDFLAENGFQCDLSPIISEKDDKIIYQKGNWIKKIIITLKTFLIRLKDVKRAKDYDIVFIFREAHMFGTTWLEKKMRRKTKKMVFDFDDAIWNMDVSNVNNKFTWVKNPDKTKDIIALCDMIFAGNEYLASYSSQFNDNVKIVPTTIDTDLYVAKENKFEKDKICIGWSGSISTIKHFETAIPILKSIRDKYPDKVYFKVIGDGNYKNNTLDIKGLPWIKEDEIKELQEIDIGIMPLPNDKWAKGKCGLKGLQYMALEISTIMSPVGVNTDIIQDGENGYIADSHEEWVEKISSLIESHSLREKIGKNGRETVVNKYSIHSEKSHYLDLFTELTQ